MDVSAFNKKAYKFLPAVAWFLVLPFPFAYNGWHWFGGYYLLYSETLISENTANYHFNYYWQPFAFLGVSLLMGFITLQIIKVLKPKPSRKR